MTSDKSTGPSSPRKEPVKERVFTLEPMKLKAIGLGVFNTGTDPHYEVTSVPKLDELLVVAKKKEPIPQDPHHYVLLYMFDNYSNTQCEVTVRLIGQNSIPRG